MATPYVAGVSSLIKQLNPNLSVDQFDAFLQQSASIFSDPATGGDYRILDVNALGILAAGGTLPEAPTSPAPEQPSTDDHPNAIGSDNANVVIGTTLVGNLEDLMSPEVRAKKLAATTSGSSGGGSGASSGSKARAKAKAEPKRRGRPPKSTTTENDDGAEKPKTKPKTNRTPRTNWPSCGRIEQP